MRSGSPLLVVLGALLVACGGPPARTPDGSALAIAPAHREDAAAAQRPKRPDDLAMWVHVEDPDAIVDLSGMRATLTMLTAVGGSDMARWAAVIDLTKPMDAIVTADKPVLGAKKKAKRKRPTDDAEDTSNDPDFQVAARVRVKDVAVVLELLGKEYDTRTEGGRVHLVKKARHAVEEDTDDGSSGGPPPAETREKDEDDELVCDFGGVKSGPEYAVCGTAAGVASAGPWLRTGPKPPDEERARAGGKGSEIARLVSYAAPLLPFIEQLEAKQKAKVAASGATPSALKEASEAAMYAMLRDVSAMTLELAKDEGDLTFASGIRFARRDAAITRGLFEKTSGVTPTDAFYRIAEDASGSVFLPGGGPISGAARWVWTSVLDEAESADRARLASRTATVERLFERPFEAGYGIDVPRARAALSGVRASKDPKKAAAALGRALEGYETARIGADVASVEALVRTWSTTKNEKEKAKAKSGVVSPTEKKTTYAVRAVPPKLGLPKGSFALDETSTEPVLGDPKKTTKTVETSFFVPTAGAGDRSATWFVTCFEDAACAEHAKAALAEKPPSGAAKDPLFERPGLLAAGHLSTLVGAFALHRVSAKMAMMGPTTSGKPAFDASTLAEIEHHLTEPKTLLPYVVVAEPKGSGGVLAFEIRGPRDGWKTLGEHLGGAAAGSASMMLMMFALAAAGTP